MVDIFDREKVFIDRVLCRLRDDFPELKIVFEHITTRQAVDFVTDRDTLSPPPLARPQRLKVVPRNVAPIASIR